MLKKHAPQKIQNRTHQEQEAIKNQDSKAANSRPEHCQLPENRMNPSRLNRSHLRFTADEYQRLVEDAKTYGDSIPNLIKAVYFKRKLPPPAMAKDDADRVLAALNRIGNNVNQIARHLNAGFREGFTPQVTEMAEALRAIKNFVLGFHGNRQDQVR
jgi:hypothetical protein